jgi:nucleotide-binding universal stress UspA family protein
MGATGDRAVAQRRIVAGSPSSKAALGWAVRQAELTGAVVEAVIAWEFPASYGLDSLLYVDYAGMAAKVLADAVAGAGDPAVVRPLVVEGHPARVLIDASAGAELLVVGSRGHGGFVGALLGSVSQQCVQYAQCPVVVIRGPGSP